MIPPALPLEVRNGRTIVLVAMLVLILGSAVGDWFVGNFSLVRWLITVAWLYAIWRGHQWARWLMVGIMSATLVWAGWLFLRSFHPFFAMYIAVGAIAATLLAFPPSVSAFFAHQRQRAAESVPPRPVEKLPEDPGRKHVDPY